MEALCGEKPGSGYISTADHLYEHFRGVGGVVLDDGVLAHGPPPELGVALAVFDLVNFTSKVSCLEKYLGLGLLRYRINYLIPNYKERDKTKGR